MKKAPLYISIPIPCNQDFAAMKPVGSGRHCESCNNIIYDFSQMSDSELFNFFQQHPSKPCGRFHNTQLNRPIVPLEIKGNFLKRTSKIAATVLAIITLRAVPAKACKTKENYTQRTLSFTEQENIFSDSIVVKGIVRDEKGVVMQNVVVSTNNGKSATTDENGRYSIAISGTAEIQNLYFQYLDHAPIVRTCSSAMDIAEFDVTVIKQSYHSNTNYTMGVPPPPPLIPFSTVTFKMRKTGILDANTRAALANVANEMKGNPFATVYITTHAIKPKAKTIADKKAITIKNYLIEREGISADRLQIRNDEAVEYEAIDIVDTNNE